MNGRRHQLLVDCTSGRRGGCIVDRRSFNLSMVAIAASAGAELTEAKTGKVARIGYLGTGRGVASQDRLEALRAGLRDQGWIEGINIELDVRLADETGALLGLARALAELNVDVICATSSTETEAARQATSSIPIVFSNHADPVATGHVASLARPGGNITGSSIIMTELMGKSLELLKEFAPQARTIGLLSTLSAPSSRPTEQAVKDAGDRLGVAINVEHVDAVEEFAEAFKRFAVHGIGGVMIPATSLTVRGRDAPMHIAKLASQYRIPTMFGARENVVAGGLMSYSPNQYHLGRRAAGFIDKILKGAAPAELPVEQATRFDFVINARTARSLQVAIPTSLLVFAEEVID